MFDAFKPFLFPTFHMAESAADGAGGGGDSAPAAPQLGDDVHVGMGGAGGEILEGAIEPLADVAKADEPKPAAKSEPGQNFVPQSAYDSLYGNFKELERQVKALTDGGAKKDAPAADVPGARSVAEWTAANPEPKESDVDAQGKPKYNDAAALIRAQAKWDLQKEQFETGLKSAADNAKAESTKTAAALQAEEDQRFSDYRNKSIPEFLAASKLTPEQYNKDIAGIERYKLAGDMQAFAWGWMLKVAEQPAALSHALAVAPDDYVAKLVKLATPSASTPAAQEAARGRIAAELGRVEGRIAAGLGADGKPRAQPKATVSRNGRRESNAPAPGESLPGTQNGGGKSLTEGSIDDIVQGMKKGQKIT